VEACLGIDLGTGSTKAVLLNGAGVQLAAASVPVQVSYPQPGWAESDPEDWWLSVKAAVERALSGVDARVSAIGLSGQMHGVVLTRADSTAVRPAILSLDRRAQADLLAYRSLPAHDLATLANPLVPGMAGPLLHWLASNDPSAFRQANWALQPKDWLRLRLVGQAGSEPSDASGTLLFDLHKGTWAIPVAEGLGIPANLLAPLGASASVAGGLAEDAALELDLPSGTPVAYGAADTAAALLGTGLSDIGAIQLTVGSAAQVVTLRQLPDPDPGLRYHIFAATTSGYWYALAGVQVAGIALSWALNALCFSWDEAYEVLGAADLTANGAFFVPHLAGARSPLMDSSARAGFFGLELRHDRAAMLRAAFEGVAFSIADAAAALPEFANASSLYLAGGGSVQRSWRQLLSDVLGKSLLVIENPNASARGAALLAGRAAGLFSHPEVQLRVVDEFEPDLGAHDRLMETFEQWKHVEAHVIRCSPAG
jgi:xylulokinase